MAVLVLVDHAAHRVRIFAGEGAVQHHLRHRDLAAHGLAAGFEIDRFGEALLRFGARLLVEQAEPLGRRLGALVVGIDFALRRDALAHLAGPDRPVGVDRQRGHDLHVGIGNRARHHDHRLFAGLPALDAFGRAERRAEKQARGLEREIVARRCRTRARPLALRRALDPSSGLASSGLRLRATSTIVLRQRRRAQRGLQVRDRAAQRSAAGGCAAVLAPSTEAFEVEGSSFAGALPAGAAFAPARAARRRGDRPSSCDRPWGNRRPDSAAAARQSDCGSRNR